MKAMSRLKLRQLVTRESGRRDTMHDKLNGDVWEAKIMKAVMQKFPVDIIKSFF